MSSRAFNLDFPLSNLPLLARLEEKNGLNDDIVKIVGWEGAKFPVCSVLDGELQSEFQNSIRGFRFQLLSPTLGSFFNPSVFYGLRI